MSTRVDLTLGVPTYNSAKYLQELLSSVSSQSLFPKKIVFTDNRSTDDTVEMIKRFKSEQPNLDIELHINESNLGIAGNYNRLCELAPAGTRWLQILDSDDYLLGSRYYETLRPVLESENGLIITSMRTSSEVMNAYVAVWEKLLSPHARVPRQIQVLGSVTTRSALIYPTNLIKRKRFIDPFFEGSDIIHTAKLSRQNRYIADARVFYRIHPQSTTTRLAQEKHDHARYLEYLRELPPSERFPHLADFFLRKRLGAFIRQSR